MLGLSESAPSANTGVLVEVSWRLWVKSNPLAKGCLPESFSYSDGQAGSSLCAFLLLSGASSLPPTVTPSWSPCDATVTWSQEGSPLPHASSFTLTCPGALAGRLLSSWICRPARAQDRVWTCHVPPWTPGGNESELAASCLGEHMKIFSPIPSAFQFTFLWIHLILCF